MRIVVVLGTMLLAATAVSVPPALQCPDIADAHVATAWQEYRAGRLGNAQRAFASARSRCPDHIDSQVGLGYVALRNAELDSARTLFARVLVSDAEHTDALAGLGLVEWRSGRYDEARAVFVIALRVDPARDDIREHLSRLPAPLPPPPVRPAYVRPDTLVHTARVNGERFEVRRGGAWAPFYIRGVNLGAAMPGRFPSEFPDSATYAGWISGMAEMGANTVRVYTLHPPSFYQALAAHNAAHPDRPLRLLHGVWAELPPDDHYYDEAWQARLLRRDGTHRGRAARPRGRGAPAGPRVRLLHGGRVALDGRPDPRPRVGAVLGGGVQRDVPGPDRAARPLPQHRGRAGHGRVADGSDGARGRLRDGTLPRSGRSPTRTGRRSTR
jgi:tetratricopeptide (TPR) repeat protein